MKNLLIPTLSSLLSLFILPAQGQWRTIYHGSDPDNDIKGASFYTPREGWIATSKYAGFTQDSGQSFVQRPVTLSNVDYNSRPVNLTFGFTPNGVKAFSRDVLLLYGDYGFEPSILYSGDGGLHWKVVYHQGFDASTYLDLQTVHKVVFPQNTKVGYAVQGNAVLKTTDGGLSWQATPFSGYQLSGLDMVSDSTGFLVGKDRLYYTGNGGRWWDAVGSAPKGIELIDFISATTGYAFTWEGLIYVTTDRGATWTLTNTAETAFLPVDVHFTDERTGYAAGGLYTLFKTENSGRTWEELEGSRSFEYLGYSFESLHFYNNSLAWASGRRDFLMKTDNAGGRTYPRAQFSVDRSLYCAQNLIQLQSRSLQTNAHRWYRNGALFSTDYATSYTPGLTPDTIMLVVENALGRDTATQTVQETLTTNFSFVSVPRDTFHCAGQPLYFDIPASNPKLTYQLCLGGGGCTTEQRGTGGLLTLTIGTTPTWEHRVEYTIKAIRVNDCGTTTVSHQHHIRMATTQINVQATADTFCAQKPLTYLKVANSRPNYSYWADTTFPKVKGNGGEIVLPVRALTGRPPYPPFDDTINIPYRFTISADYDLLACPTSNPKVQVQAIARYSEAAFDTRDHEYFTGDTAMLVNKSRQGAAYTWTFDNGASASPLTQTTPNGVYWTTPGQKQIRLDTYTKEGCLSSATTTIEVFRNTPPALTQSYCRKDSLLSDNYVENRSFYEDEYGNYYLTGGRKGLKDFRFYHRGGEGWFLYKFNKDHQLQWKIERSSIDAYEYNRRHHLVFENVVTDRNGYIYLLGQSYNNPYVSAGEEQYPLHRATTVFMKVSPHGKIVWVKQLYNDPTYQGLHFTGGTLLRGKHDDFYIITQHIAGGGGYLMDKELLYNYASQSGVILRVDRNGTILDKKLYPAQYNELFAFSEGENFDRLPRAQFDSVGRIAIYTRLKPSEISGNRIDDAILDFDPAQVPSALLYYDTAGKKIVEAKPVYRTDTTGTTAGVDATSLALDTQGNYYASWVELEEVRPATQFYNSYKPRGVIAAYSAQGKQLWIRRAEGLRPESLQAIGGKVYVMGQNYNGYGFSPGAWVYFEAQTPIDSTLQKVTVFYDSAYRATGLRGIGAVDMILARLEAGTGAVESISVQGTQREEESFLIQKGYGNQLIATGQGSFYMTTARDTVSKLYMLRVPTGKSCSTTFEQPSRFLSFDNPAQESVCTDTLVKLRWSAYDVQQVRLYYSKDSGTTYQLLADSVNAATHELVIHLDRVPAAGYTRFKIVDIADPSLSDTLSRFIGRKPYSFTLTANPPEISCLSDKVTLTSNATCSDCAVLWNTGDTTRTITVSKSGWYQVKYSNACGSVEGYKNVFIYPMPPINLSVSSTTVCEGMRVHFKATGSGWQFHWTGPNLTKSFGDSTSALPPAGTSIYKMIANNGYGCQQVKEIVITAGPPTPPTVDISLEGCGSGPLLFKAKVTNGGATPTYQWAVNGVAAGTDSILSRSALPAGAQVSCTVTAKDVCATNNTATASVAVNCTTTGLPMVDGLETYSVSPNPSAGRYVIKIRLKAVKEVSWSVWDIKGRVVYQSAVVKRSGSLERELDLTPLAAGVYYLTIKVGKEQFTEKLVKW